MGFHLQTLIYYFAFSYHGLDMFKNKVMNVKTVNPVPDDLLL